jgi:tetratricopeptide (TPR) repeat protein
MSNTADLLATAIQHHQAGNLYEAERLYREVLAGDAVNAEAYRRLGTCCQAQGRWPEAEANLNQALIFKPDFGEAHNDLGIVFAVQGKVTPAIECFELAIRYMPLSPDAPNNLGIMLAMQRRFDEAAASFRHALDLRPDFAEAHFNIGNAFREQGLFVDAIVHFERALELRPNYSEAFNNLGLALRESGRTDEAINAMQRAVQLRPDYGKAHHNLALALMDRGYLTGAIASFRQALHLMPQSFETLLSLGGALREAKQLDESVAVLHEALRLRSDSAEARNTLGNTYVEMDRHAAAEAEFREAIRLRPDLADAHNNFANMLGRLGRHTEALTAYQEAIRLRPEYAEAYTNRSFIQLLLGNFAEGWQGYDWRWKCKKTPAIVATDLPVWDGTPLKGRTILLQEEQGLGDTIQFIRYAPLVKARGGRVILHCQPGLMPLLAGCPGIDLLADKSAPHPPADVRAPLLSLPGIFRTNLGSIPGGVPYLFAQPQMIESWREKLSAISGYRVGIAWQGNPQHPGDRFRSIPLERFGELAKVEGVSLISLQQGYGTEQIAQLSGRFPLAVVDSETNSTAGVFMDTAAIMANLDLVITVDTAVAHLAGALGLSAWIPLSTAPDWRWLLGRNDSPWYPSLRLFRQQQLGRWDDVFVNIVEALRHAVRKAKTPTKVLALPDMLRRLNEQLRALDDEIIERDKALREMLDRRKELAGKIKSLSE